MTRRQMLVFALPLLLWLASCGERPDASGGVNSGEAPDVKASTRQALVPAGNSGLIPKQSGFVEVDLQRIEAAKIIRLCAVDAVNGEKATGQAVALTGSDRIKVVGWALTPEKRSPASLAVILQGDDKAYALRANGGGSRADVARVMKSEEARRAGYSIGSDLRRVTPGRYAVSVLQDTGGTPTICTSRFAVTVAVE